MADIRGIRRIPGRPRSAETEIRECAEVSAQTRHDRNAAETTWGIVSLGSCDGAIREALDVLGRQKIGVDYLRVKAFPFKQ